MDKINSTPKVFAGHPAWTPQDVAKMQKGIAQGMTYQEIGDALGRTRESVSRKVHTIKVAAQSEGKAVIRRHRTWSRDEIDVGVRLYREGVEWADIADQLGRTVAATQEKIRAISKAGGHVKKAAPRNSGGRTVAAAREKSIARQVAALNKSGPARTSTPVHEGWTPARDLHLVEALCRGSKLGAVADGMGCSKIEARQRWIALVSEPTVEAQQAALADLRARVSA